MAQQAFIFHPGRWYVEYPDGNKSRLMPFWWARDYRKVFGGKLRFWWGKGWW